MESQSQAYAQDGLIRGYSPQGRLPLRGYALLTGLFTTGVASFTMGQHRSGHKIPTRMGLLDLLIFAAATQRLSRLVSKDRVTSFLRAPFARYTGDAGPNEVSEEVRGSGLRLAVGELLICHYCTALWIAAALVGGYARWPRQTRLLASVFAVLSVSDVLQHLPDVIAQKAS